MGKSSSAKAEVNEYRMSLHYGVCLAPAGGVRFKKIKIDDKIIWQGDVADVSYADINIPDLFGGPTKEGGVAGRVYFLPGKPDQVMPNELAGRFSDPVTGLPLTNATCPAFRGLASLFFVGSPQAFGLYGGAVSLNSGGFYWTANSPFIRAVSVEVECAHTLLGAPDPMIGGNVNPGHLIYEGLVSQEWGMGAPDYLMNVQSFVDLAALMKVEDSPLSLMWKDQSTVEAFISEVIDHIHATVFVDPRTGLFTIKALRDDYTFSELREINPGNAVLKKFQRKVWGETANELVVSWTNPQNEQEETVSDQDIGNVAIQGGVISDNRNYYAARSAELAKRLLDRDLRMLSAPLASCEAEVDRSFYDVVPGEVVRLSWPRHKLFDVVFRVLNVRYGKKRDPKIKLTLMEDIFSLTKPPTVAPPGSGWAGEQEVPAPIDNVEIITLPAFLAQRETVAQSVQPTYPEVIAGVLAFKAGKDNIAYDLYYESTLSNGTVEWTMGGVKSLLGRAAMLTPLYQEAVSMVQGLPHLGTARGPEVGSLVFIGTGGDEGMEIGLLRAYAADTWTVDRGVLDTIPRAWPVDTPVWFVPLSAVIADDAQFKSVGETVDYKILTRTSLGTLALASAPTNSATMTARPHAPLRPANVQINGQGFGEYDATGQTDLTITWATRNRLFEDGQVTKWTDGAVTPEYLQQTVITVFREDGTKMFHIKGLWTEVSKVIPIAHIQEESKVFIRLSAERSGILSIQSYGLWVKNIPQVASPAPPPADDDGPPPPSPPPPSGDPTPEPVPGTEPPPFGYPGGGGGGGTGEWNYNQFV